MFVNLHWQTSSQTRPENEDLGIEHLRPHDVLMRRPTPSCTPRLQPFVFHPHCHTIDTFLLTAKSPPLVASQILRSKTRGSRESRRPTSQMLAASKSPSLHVAHVAHGPSQVAPRSGLHRYWERILLFIGSFRSLFVRFSIPFCVGSSPLHSSFLFYLSLLPSNVAAPLSPPSSSRSLLDTIQ